MTLSSIVGFYDATDPRKSIWINSWSDTVRTIKTLPSDRRLLLKSPDGTWIDSGTLPKSSKPSGITGLYIVDHSDTLVIPPQCNVQVIFPRETIEKRVQDDVLRILHIMNQYVNKRYPIYTSLHKHIQVNQDSQGLGLSTFNFESLSLQWDNPIMELGVYLSNQLSD